MVLEINSKTDRDRGKLFEILAKLKLKVVRTRVRNKFNQFALAVYPDAL